MRRGAFIVLEGIDRTGKTTQAARLVDALKAEGQKVVAKRFPDRTTATGTVINQYLQNKAELDDHVIHLLYSANRWEAKAELEAILASGTHLIVDRYSYSGVAFSAAKEGMDFEWCCEPERGLPAPDVVIFLEMSIEEAKERGDYGAERYEKEEFQRKVKEMYERLKDKRWVSVNAAQSRDQVHDELKRIAHDTIAAIGERQPVGTMWQ
jgi:dTMP kinase